MAQKFKQALMDMLTDGEYDKCIRNTKGKEKRHLIALKNTLIKSGDLTKVPIWAILHVINSPLLFKDIITYMVAGESSNAIEE